MTSSSLIVVGASAGGTEALLQLVRALPADLPAAVCIVTHIPAHTESLLPQILGRAGPLPASHPQDGERFQAGHIYCAPSDHHLLVDGDLLLVRRGPLENRFRPSIDALFRSAAYTHTDRVIGVVLSGLLDDGTSGLWSIKRLGGVTMVQDPEDALYDSMPVSALQQVDIDHVVRAGDMAATLSALLAESSSTPKTALNEEVWHRLGLEVSIAAGGRAFEKGVMNLGTPSTFACPECHGVLVEFGEGVLMRYRCHTGHAYSASALLSQITEQTEQVLIQGQRALEEETMLLTQLGQGFATRGDQVTAQRFFQKAEVAEARGFLLLKVLDHHEILSEVKATALPPLGTLPADN
jgi:two-component system chemotaxis response regulator CheB